MKSGSLSKQSVLLLSDRRWTGVFESPDTGSSSAGTDLANDKTCLRLVRIAANGLDARVSAFGWYQKV